MGCERSGAPVAACGSCHGRFTAGLRAGSAAEVRLWKPRARRGHGRSPETTQAHRRANQQVCLINHITRPKRVSWDHAFLKALYTTKQESVMQLDEIKLRLDRQL